MKVRDTMGRRDIGSGGRQDVGEAVRQAGRRGTGLTTGLIAGAVVLTLTMLSGCDGSSDSNTLPGLLEADLRDVGAEVTGRLAEVSVAEGDRVAVGAPLFRLSAPAAEAAVAEAAARVAEARARLADARAQVERPAEVAVLEAARDRAATALRLSRRDLDRARSLASDGVASQARLDAAQATFLSDRAALVEAERRVTAARQPARADQIVAAESALDAARAAYRAAQAHLDDYTVMAPVAGRVDRQWFDRGEVVPAGRPVVSLLAPDDLEIHLWVPEVRRAALSVGDRLGVSCDGCPQGMTATVTFISAEADFLPPMMLSRDQRHKLSYRVEAKPSGALSGLAAGQPVTVHLPDTGPEGGGDGG